MLSDTKIIALDCLVDDLLKGLHHYEDERARLSDSEGISTAFISVLSFGGHLDNARHFMKMKNYMPLMLGNRDFVDACTA